MAGELFDTIVIGAGPVGSYAASQLAGYGFKVAVLEEHQQIGEPMQCSGIIGVECFERFHLSTASVLREANSAKLFSPSGKIIHLQSKKPEAYIVDRIVFDQLLADAAKSKGVQYYTPYKAESITITSDKVTALTETGETFEGRTAIIASGFYSKLPRKIGVKKFSDFITGAQAEVTIKEPDVLGEIEVYFDQALAPGFFAWLVPTAPQRALAGLFSRKTPRKHLQMFLQKLYEQGRIASANVSIMHGGIPLRPLGRTYCERLVVAVDAAGQVKPTTGGGVYYGMICAQLATDALKAAFAENDFSERFMSGYQKAWHEEIGGELRNGYYARRIYEKCSNRVIDYLFDLSVKKGLQEIVNESGNISFDWHSKAFIDIMKQTVPRLFRH